jgi:hypothetical protein
LCRDAETGEAMKKNSGYTDQQLSEMAMQHDEVLLSAVAHFSNSAVDLSKAIAAMRDEKLKLWRYVKDPQTNGDNRGCFRTWREYAKHRLGKISEAKIYEYLSLASLKVGKKPVSDNDIEQLGVKKAAQIARLPEHLRTKKFVEESKQSSFTSVKRNVDVMLQNELPVTERRAVMVPFTIALPQEVVDLIEEIERTGIFLESVRDNDRSWSLRAKLWHQIVWYFYDAHKEELRSAEKYREDYFAEKKLHQAQVASQSVN